MYVDKWGIHMKKRTRTSSAASSKRACWPGKQRWTCSSGSSNQRNNNLGVGKCEVPAGEEERYEIIGKIQLDTKKEMREN